MGEASITIGSILPYETGDEGTQAIFHDIDRTDTSASGWGFDEDIAWNETDEEDHAFERAADVENWIETLADPEHDRLGRS